MKIIENVENFQVETNATEITFHIVMFALNSEKR